MAPTPGTMQLRIAVLVCLITPLAACTPSDPAPTVTGAPATPVASPTASPTPPPTPSPPPTTDPALAEAEAAVLAAYRAYWEVSAAALSDPLAPLPSDFDRLIVDKARSGLAESLLWAEQNNVVMVGAPVISPAVESITIEGERTAHIVDCVDSTDWILSHRSTGEPASPATSQKARVTADASAIYYDDRWVIREVTLNRDEPC